MPAFVRNGPNIPESLLQAHEDGRVVFFTGAGISVPAGLPLFQGLVDDIYRALGTSKNPVEAKAYDKDQYDSTLDLLERRYPGKRAAVRSVVPKILEPKWRRKRATEVHEALLLLSTDRKGSTRLVTTNFDRIFQRVIERRKLGIPCLSAPFLPIPKPTRWHGLVHLHGSLSKHIDEPQLNRLVLTSGDFGLAYLTERWASRFVSELFRYYTVCFIGYGINDPVMRYMMDALSADELLGEAKTEAYAFASYKAEQADVQKEWEAKGVIPLLYNVPENKEDHSTLYRTLKEWAATYRDGVRGKEMIVAQHAPTPPLVSSRSDFSVGRVLWALTDGMAAKHFADLDPVPPLEWLGPLSAAQFEYADLPRFGVAPNGERDNDLEFSFISRPSPYTHGSWMEIAEFRRGKWDEVMFQIARWLRRHLNDPKLVLWLVKHGGKLKGDFAFLVRRRLDEFDKAESQQGKGKQEPVTSDIKGDVAPSALMRVLWRILLAGRVASSTNDFDLYDWTRRFKEAGLVPSLRLELREMLAPCVVFRDPFPTPEELRVPEERISDLVDWELSLATKHVHTILRDMGDNVEWNNSLPLLLDDFTGLLRDALDLSSELDGATSKSDHSYVAQPSISKHEQNREFHDWTALIDLTRDAWLATAQFDSQKARTVAERWMSIPYPLFKRLAYFAAANGDVIAPGRAVEWLLVDERWWLWSSETKREAIRLLVALGPRLSRRETAKVQEAILIGPPRHMYAEDLDDEKWRSIVDRSVWLRLAKSRAAGMEFDSTGMRRLEELSQQYPSMRLAKDESDEFAHWMSDGKEWRKHYQTPRRRKDLMKYLETYTLEEFWETDDWKDRCRNDFPTAATALCGLVRKDAWPAERWREALQVWADEPLLRRSWRYMALPLSRMPDDTIGEVLHSYSWWLKAQSNVFTGQESLFFGFVRRILTPDDETDAADSDEPVARAINHPIGHATEALLKWWYRQGPKDAVGLPKEVKEFFTELTDTTVAKYRHGRALLAAHAIALFRVDEQWTKERLLPLFDWQRSEYEARAAWDGFLWTPRLYHPLLLALKEPFLETAEHYGKLGKYAEQYAAFLTFAALDPADTFTTEELTVATRTLPQEGLQTSAQALVRALEGASDQRGEYWHNRVLPYMKQIWPQSVDLITPGISENLARLCIAAGDAFPEAVRELRHWLQPVTYPDFLVYQLHEAGLSQVYPDEALTFLEIIMGDDSRRYARHLAECLDEIEEVDGELATDRRLFKLRELIRRQS